MKLLSDEGTRNSTTQYILTISEIQESATYECLGRNVAGEGNRVRSQITVIKPSGEHYIIGNNMEKINNHPVGMC